MKKRILTLTICLPCMALFFSCNNDGHKHNKNSHAENKANGVEAFQFRLNLTPGSKFHTTLLNKSSTSLEVNGQEKELSNKYEIGLQYEVDSDSSGNTVLKIKYDKVHVVAVGKDGEEQVIDADEQDQAFDSVDKILRYIKDGTLVVTLSNTGNVISVKGNKEMSDKIMAGLDARDEQTKEKVQRLIGQLLGDEFIKENLSQGFKIFPDSAIYPGDSWNKKSAESASINFISDTKYTLESIEDGMAEISVEGSIENNSNGKSNLMGNEVIADLQGTQTGTIHADTKTGILLDAHIKTAIDGDVQVMGKSVPITIKLEKNIAVKKM